MNQIEHRQYSLNKLTTMLVSVVLLVTLVTSASGIYLLYRHYQAAENRFDTEARDTLRNAARALSHQVQFYQGILTLIATKPEINDLVEFGNVDELTKWTRTIARMLPGTLGAALASPDGVVFGELLPQRVGAACQADLRHFSRGDKLKYPPIHTDRPGLEHFDLFTRIERAGGQKSGHLFISFRLDVLGEVIQNLVGEGQLLQLRDSRGDLVYERGDAGPESTSRSFSESVPGTDWRLVLSQQNPDNLGFYSKLILLDMGILIVAAVIIAYLARLVLQRFTVDLVGVHQALQDVYHGKFRRVAGWSGLQETEMLMPDLELIARRLQEQQTELREQALLDATTGLSNRRYFDIMLKHEYARSGRKTSAMLALLDVNKFKAVNEALGHEQGDAVLADIARFLKENCRASDILARLGGNEFALIVINMDAVAVRPWLQSLLQRFDEFMQGHRLASELKDGITMSAGVSVIDAGRYATGHEVFNAADDAVFSARHRDEPGSRFTIATPPEPREQA